MANGVETSQSVTWSPGGVPGVLLLHAERHEQVAQAVQRQHGHVEAPVDGGHPGEALAAAVGPHPQDLLVERLLLGRQLRVAVQLVDGVGVAADGAAFPRPGKTG